MAETLAPIDDLVTGTELGAVALGGSDTIDAELDAMLADSVENARSYVEEFELPSGE